jgi:RNA 2',3'-cyclic 3'-phosphodiesterase
MIRLFVGLPIPDSIADALEGLQHGLPGAAWRTRAHFHITLGFIGEVCERTAEDLDSALGQIRIAPFYLSLGGADTFGGDLPDAVWMSVQAPAALKQLHTKVTQAARQAGISFEARRYVPHVTTAYLRRSTDPIGLGRYIADHALFRSRPWIADRFYLYESHLSHSQSLYTIAAEYPLVG